MTKAAEPIILEHRVDLYIPSQCICGTNLPEHLRKKVVEEIKSKFDKWFGSHSEILIKGDWPLPDRTIAREDVADIFSFCTVEALEQHQEDVDHLAVDIANRLTQDRVLRVFDNLKVVLWPNTLENLVPKKNCACHGGATANVGVIVQPLDIGKADRLSKMLIIQGILRSFNSTDHARKLFCDVLNYNYAKGELPCTKWPDSIRSLLTSVPTLLADHNGFKIFYLRISADELWRGVGRQVIQRIYKDDPTFRGLIVVSDQPQKRWELVNIKVHSDDSSRLVLRRMRVGIEAVRTATERIATLEITEVEDASIAAEELQKRHDQAFDVEAVTKAFFADVANWYFWALKNVRFPKDAPKEKDGHDHVSVIRLITRLIFCWFVKEKGLIPADLFDERKLADQLVSFAPGKVSKRESVFYKAILQNLFFATLNTEMDKRNWRRNGQNFMAHSLYRHKDLFVRPDEALALFKNIPFLNGGLFECLDKILGDKGQTQYERIDGFSDRADSQPTVPDFLFFGEEREVDLSEDYGDKKFKKVKVRGLIQTLNHYHFTVEESTPLEEEVALDPELAGKIFENLLAAYNPETGATARKQTGSFYTPREIVNYMVDEALIAYLKGKVEESFPEAADIEPRLRHLFSYEKEGHRFTMNEVEVLIAGVDQLKALDPAVGSGAFPMGILHKLVFILGRLDPRNEEWKERQKKRLRDAIAIAERIEDSIIRENAIKELEQQLDGIDEAFQKNTLDYGRKLYLIENCLYGVDIQPIAVQIAKMRFFISLVADQKVDPSAENFGVRPLPNLETKLVAANTLIGIDKPKQMKLRNPRIEALEGELRRVRERHFLARTPTSKTKCRDQDIRLRNQIAELLKKDGWGDKTAKQLAGWDPYDQNASSGFFDPEWMFGVKDGFDVVIGNPPYGFRKIHNSEEKRYFKEHFRVARASYEHHFLFYERTLDLINKTGTHSFIAPVTWVTIPSAKALREFVLVGFALKEICWFGNQVFLSASVNNLISIITRTVPDNTYVVFFESLESFPHDPRMKNGIRQSQFVDDGYYIGIFEDSSERHVLQKIIRNSEPLKKYGRPCSGYNPYEVGKGVAPDGGPHTEQTVQDKPYHSDRKRGKDWQPEVVGRNLQRYGVSVTGKRWVKYGPWLAAARDPNNFVGKRLLVQEITGGPERRIVATYYDEPLYYSRDVIPVKIEMSFPHAFYLLAIVNSGLISWYHHKRNPKAQKGLFPKVLVGDLEELPVRPINSSNKQDITAHDEIVMLVTSILATKKKDPAADVSALEREIDEIVYKLYGLTKDEIKIVEGGR